MLYKVRDCVWVKTHTTNTKAACHWYQQQPTHNFDQQYAPVWVLSTAHQTHLLKVQRCLDLVCSMALQMEMTLDRNQMYMMTPRKVSFSKKRGHCYST